MKSSFRKELLGFLITYFVFFISPVEAQTLRFDAASLVPRLEVSLSPRSGSFVVGSLIEVPILVNTRGQNINGIEIRINFDKDKLSIINPLIGSSVVGVWVETPKYDNTKGTASYVGVIPDGINTGSGLIGAITFKAKNTGDAKITFDSTSKVLLSDGRGSEAQVDYGRADYSIIPKAPEGVVVYSDTHQFQSNWYNNDSPSLAWDRDPGVGGFSYVLDNKPLTVPENKINTNDTNIFFENLDDGIWYFHIKASKNGVWGNTGHFLVRIDTTPPADFTPRANYLVGTALMIERALVSFFTTDTLSGVSHFEVGVIDKSDPVTVSPIFVYADNPYQVPVSESPNLRVIVRAIDSAGNVRDAFIDIEPPLLMLEFAKDHFKAIILIVIGIVAMGMTMHYLIGHHVIKYIKLAFNMMRKEDSNNIENNDV